MTDPAMIPRVAEVMAHRVTDRLRTLMFEDAGGLERRLLELDGHTLGALLRLTQQPADAAGSHHLGVLGVDHSLNRLVLDQTTGNRATARDMATVDLDQLDDEDLIAAARYVPETLPGYMLG